MPKGPFRLSLVVIVALASLGIPGSYALAQTPEAPAASAPPPAPSTSGEDRLFLGFAEEAAVVPGQWWEPLLAYSRGPVVTTDVAVAVPGPVRSVTRQIDLDRTRTVALSLQAAFQPWKNLELGGRVGFGRTSNSFQFNEYDPINRVSVPREVQDGGGATDLDFWGKYHFGKVGGNAELAVGGIATVPTGDDAAGLGNNAFSLKGFGSIRVRSSVFIFSGHVGLRITGNGSVHDRSLNGKASASLGAGFLFPLSDQVTIVAETLGESERFQNQGADFRLVGGVNWRPFTRGSFRGSVSLGLTDGAPRAQVSIGYAFVF